MPVFELLWHFGRPVRAFRFYEKLQEVPDLVGLGRDL